MSLNFFASSANLQVPHSAVGAWGLAMQSVIGQQEKSYCVLLALHSHYACCCCCCY